MLLAQCWGYELLDLTHLYSLYCILCTIGFHCIPLWGSIFCIKLIFPLCSWQWSGKQKQPVHVKVFNKMEHMEILKTPETIQFFVGILKNITERKKKLQEERMQRREEPGDREEDIKVRTVGEVYTEGVEERGQRRTEEGREEVKSVNSETIVGRNTLQSPLRKKSNVRQERNRKRWYNDVRFGGGRRRALGNELRSSNLIGEWKRRSTLEENRKEEKIMLEVL